MASHSQSPNQRNQSPQLSAQDWVRDAFKWLLSRSEESQNQQRRLGLPAISAEPLEIVALGVELSRVLSEGAMTLHEALSDPSERANTIRCRLSLLSRTYAAALQQACLDALLESNASLVREITNVAVDLYLGLHGLGIVDGQGFLLQTLAWTRSPQSLEKLTELLIELPPQDWTSTALGLSPLMRDTQWPVEAVFPSLLEGLHEPTMIAPILDLANYCQHQRMVSQHPASKLENSLTEMLGGVVARLGQLEEDPTRFGDDPKQIQRVLSDAIAVCVSLCDALGLIGFEGAIGKLHQALELRHRRVQTEAAGALARMDQKIGRDSLVALAAEPVSRLRAIHYADELGLSDQIDEGYTHPCALAEAELALWLAQPQQLGLPPKAIEVIDQRMLFWPSFDEPQACFLFRFQYLLPQGEWSNIGMAGPLVHSFAADLADLPVFDIYSAFAGWHAEHPEIYEIPVEHWNSAEHRQALSLIRSLEEHQHQAINPLWLGCFLGEICLVAETTVDGATGVAVTDGLETIWYPNVGRLRPLGPFEAYSIYKGRKILRTFNADMSNDLDLNDES